MPMLEGLQNKIGPLPVWAWGGLGAAGVFFLIARNKGASNPPTSSGGPQVSQTDAGAAMGAAQLANIWQLSSDQNQQLQALSNQQNKNLQSSENQAATFYESIRNLLYALGAPVYPGGYFDPNNPAGPPMPGSYGGGANPTPTGSGAGGMGFGAPIHSTSALTPAMNAPASPSPLGPWYNGAPGPYVSMYAFSPN